VKREDIFITTKLFKADIEDIDKACRTSLMKLQTTYIDLYLLHWMVTETWVNKETGKVEFLKVPIHKIWE